MYYIIYGLLYTLSLLPFFILYRISDLAYLLIYYIIGYRKKVVMYNLSVAFPDKSREEKVKIAKQFYKNFTDTFIEAIKVLSISNATFDKHCITDKALLDEMADKGKNVQIFAGHQMNWEYANLVFARNTTRAQWTGIYKEIHNKPLNRLFLKLRSRFGGIFISTAEFKTKSHLLFQSKYGIGLIADQNTAPQNGYWMYFFTRPVPFYSGPHKSAVKGNNAVLFSTFVKKKRGYYHYELVKITENGNDYTPEQLARMYRDFLEAAIRKEPANYLWTHKRWKHEYREEYAAQWIDTRSMP